MVGIFRTDWKPSAPGSCDKELRSISSNAPDSVKLAIEDFKPLDRLGMLAASH
jgi:hypothetical protein